MTQQGKILVTGATGNIGRHVVSGLLDADADVRALTRNPDAAGLPDGVEVVRGDLSDPETLEAALHGVDVVFLLWPTADDSATAALDKITKHARRVVYLSSAGVRDDLERQADPINQSHAELERRIENSGSEWTFLRPTGFATNTLGWAGLDPRRKRGALALRRGDQVADPRARHRGGGRPCAHRGRARRYEVRPDRTLGADPGGAGTRYRRGHRSSGALGRDLAGGREGGPDHRLRRRLGRGRRARRLG